MTMKQPNSKPSRVRKDFRFPSDLILWAENFARQKNTNLTQLLIDQLTALRERNEQ